MSFLIKFSIQYTTIQLTKVSNFFQWELTGASGPLLMYSFITAWYQRHLVYQRLLTYRHSLLGHDHAVSSLLHSHSGQSQGVLPTPHDACSSQHTFLSYMFCGFVRTSFSFYCIHRTNNRKDCIVFLWKIPAGIWDGRKLTENYGKRQLSVFYLLIYSYSQVKISQQI